MSRTANSIRNVAASIFGQLLNNVLRFVCRTVFIYTLGKEYLGIASLYTNILSLLNMTELGFSTAITYSLYKPLAEQNSEEICSLMQFYKKAYRTIGLIIFSAGLCLMPFLPKLMNGTTDKVNIYLYFFLYLMQTVVSYLFFAYKATLLDADQKRYITDIVVYIVQVTMNLIQILILITLRSFLLYTVVSVVIYIVQNMVTAIVVDRKYPYLKEKAGNLSKEKQNAVFKQVYATSLYRICNTIGSSTDNLIISTYISVVMVGLYDNYNMIIMIIQKLIQGIVQAFTSSLGNLYVLEGKEKNEFTFRCLNRLNSWMVAFCSVCFLVLLQPFVELWAGMDFLLDYRVVVIIVLNFATNFMQLVVQNYKNASGLFLKGKYRPVATVILNLGISIILVKHIGLSGVFLGSIISRLTTTWWFDAWILYRHGFEKSPIGYYMDCIVTVGLIYGTTVLIRWICLPWAAVSWMGIIIRGTACVIIFHVVYIMIYGKSEEMHYLKEKCLYLIRMRTGCR